MPDSPDKQWFIISLKLSIAARQNPHLTATLSVRQVGSWTVWSAGPVIGDSDLLGKAVLCAESLPMGIMHGMLPSLPVKVKYHFKKKKFNNFIEILSHWFPFLAGRRRQSLKLKKKKKNFNFKKHAMEFSTIPDTLLLGN